MKTIAKLLLITLVLFSTMVIADDKISSELQARLNVIRSQDKIPVVVFYEGLPSFEEVAREYRFLGDQELIKDQVIRVLKEKAESQHYWLKQMCESMNDRVAKFRSIWIVNGVAIEATASAIREIAEQPNVEKIVLDEPVPMLVETRGLAWGVSKIKADAVWKYHEGKGVVVAVIDTGINEHGDLKGRVVDGKNYIDSTKPPRDDHSHGTHCAGTIAGDGKAGGTATGVAPKATVMAIKVLGSNGSGQWSNLWEAIEYTVTAKDVKVISMSLGGKPDATTRDRLRTACKVAIDKGIIPVIAAGNSGPSAKSVGSPGDVPEIISVGATDSNDNIASFSSRGPVVWESEMIKPDVSAPGVSVVSCKHDDATGYRTMSGTSMATPHVAGVVALMVSANPNLNTEKAKSILENTATDLGTPGKDNDYGAGRVNADTAVTAANSLTLMTVDRGEERWEMVVKEMSFTANVDANGNINLSQNINNDIMPATVTIWVDVKETEGRKGYYYVDFTLTGPNGTKTGTAKVDFDNIPSDPNKYDSKYGFNCGNFDLVKGDYTGSIASKEPNPKVRNVTITLTGKATWPARN